MKSKWYLENIVLVFLASLCVVLLGLAIFGDNGIITYRELKKSYAEMQNKVNALEEENRKLTEEINLLRNDPAYIEKIAREELGMIKPGEVIFYVRKGDNK